MSQAVSLSGAVPVLETERLRLRAPNVSDWPLWRAFAETDRARFLRAEDHDDAAAWRSFGHVIGHWVLRGYGGFVITAKGDDTAMGMVGPWYPEGWPEREIGWTLWSQATEGQGFATEAALAARRYAFDVLNWSEAVSYIDQGNTRSIALAERLGAALDTGAKVPGPDPKRPDILVYRHMKDA